MIKTEAFLSPLEYRFQMMVTAVLRAAFGWRGTGQLSEEGQEEPQAGEARGERCHSV